MSTYIQIYRYIATYLPIYLHTYRLTHSSRSVTQTCTLVYPGSPTPRNPGKLDEHATASGRVVGTAWFRAPTVTFDCRFDILLAVRFSTPAAGATETGARCLNEFTPNCLPCILKFRRVQADGRSSARGSGNCHFIRRAYTLHSRILKLLHLHPAH